jgi:O-antigen ligase
MPTWDDNESLVNPLSRRAFDAADPSLEVRNRRFTSKSPEATVDVAPAPTVPKIKPVNQVKALPQRGHSISYFGLFLFTIVLYFRPYEFSSVLGWTAGSAFWIALATLAIFLPSQLALRGNLTARPAEVNLILILTVLALLSIPIGSNPAESWTTFNDTFIKAVLIFVVMINVVSTEHRLNGLIYLSFAVSLLLSLYSIMDYWNGNLSVDGYRVKPMIGGIFGNPNDMAIHLVTMVPIALGMAFGSRNILKRVALLVSAVLFVAAIVVTYSRGGFLGLVGAAVVFTWVLARKKKGLGLLILFLSAGALMVIAPGNYLGRVLSIFGLAGDPTGSATARKTVLIHSLIVAIRNPLGVGMGNYRFMAPHDAVSHNAYTQVATEMGIPALIVYILFMVKSFRRLRQINYDDSAFGKRVYYLSVGLQAALVGYMVSSFFASVAYQWYVYYLVGFSFSLWRITAFFNDKAPGAAKTQ